MEPFIVQNVGNTCYIDSLLFGLFFTPSSIDTLLNKDLKSGDAIYLQEYLKVHFVNQIRNNLTVNGDVMEMIRILCVQLGWRSDMIDESDNEELYNQQDVNEFYTFLIETFEGQLIEIKRRTLTGALDDSDDIGENEALPFIPLSIPKIKPDGNTDIKSITVKEMLHNWMYDNQSDIKRYIEDVNNTKKEQTVTGLNIYDIINNPNVIALSINRFADLSYRDTTDIIIQKKISPFANQQITNRPEWTFHMAICHKGDSYKEGHYYALIYHSDGHFYMFDDLDIPCMLQVSMSDKSITDRIKKDCVFLIYRHTS
jgi:uncharacterized UBP type Zn finger protein